MKITLDVAQILKNPSALTQEQGDLIYNQIIKLFDNGDNVVLDFSDVESMISPFLNNSIGQLYGKYTSDFLTKHLELKSFPASKNSTLNIVISNAKKFYANQKSFAQTAKDVLDVE